LKSFLRNYYGYAFCYDFIFAYAVYNALFEFRGLSVLQISILLVWWSFTTIMFEIPSGALADHWSRQKLLILAPLIKAFCFISWYFANGNFYLYALGFMFWSLGSSFVSGTDEALLFDALKQNCCTTDYELIRGRKHFFYQSGVALSCVFGGFIAYYNLDTVLWVSVLPLLAACGFAFGLKDTIHPSSTSSENYLAHFSEAAREIRLNGRLRYLFVLGVLTFGVFDELEEFDQLYYKFIGVPLYAFGFLAFLTYLLHSLGAVFAHRFKDSDWLEYVLPLVCSILVINVGIFAGPWLLIPLLLGYLLISPLRIIVDGKIQQSINSGSRATVTSAQSLFLNLVGIPFMICFGLLSRVWDLRFGYVFYGVVLLGGFFWILNRNRKLYPRL